MNNIKQIPILGQVITVLDIYPRLSAWIVLSIGIVGLLIYEARDVGLTSGNWIALILASIAVSGLCIWIVSWEDEDEVAATASTEPVVVKSESAPAAATTEVVADTPSEASSDSSGE